MSATGTCWPGTRSRARPDHLPPYADDNKAVRLANYSEFGLSGTVFTAHRDRVHALARRVETGNIGVNGYLTDLTAPFGGIKRGIKHSGLGRELGHHGLTDYQQLKTIYLN